MLEKNNKQKSKLLIEVLAILGFVVVLSLLLPQMRGLFELIPIAYLLTERRIRRRSYEEIGFKLRLTIKNVKDNWHLVLLVSVVSPFVTLLVAKGFIPDYVEHVRSRIPMLTLDQLVPLLIMITVGTFAEEIVYRGFFQERLGWFMGTAISIMIPSVVFSFMHYSPGAFKVVAYDIFTIFIDSLIYSLIYHRTKNIFASWIPHYLSDIVGVIVMILLLK